MKTGEARGDGGRRGVGGRVDGEVGEGGGEWKMEGREDGEAMVRGEEEE